MRLPDERQPDVSLLWHAGPRERFQTLLVHPATGDILTPRATAGGDFFYRFHFELRTAHQGRWVQQGRWIVGVATLQRLRGAGWVLLAAALAHAVGRPAPTVPMGLVWWGVALSLAALAATALATWRPRWLPTAGVAALLAALFVGAAATGCAGAGPG